MGDNEDYCDTAKKLSMKVRTEEVIGLVMGRYNMIKK